MTARTVYVVTAERRKGHWNLTAVVGGAVVRARSKRLDQAREAARRAISRRLADPASAFETDLEIEELYKATRTKHPYHAVFIRAPIIQSVGGNAKVLSALEDGRIVAAQQGHLLATSFHPELTDDTRFHEYFISLAG